MIRLRVRAQQSIIRLGTGVMVNGQAVGGGGGVTDHGSLTGLAGDDHPQYYNQARGDARYSQLGHTHGASGGERYVHEQTVASAEWTINHGLDLPIVSVDIRDDNGYMMIAGVLETSQNQVKVQFASPQTGKAVIQ